VIGDMNSNFFELSHDMLMVVDRDGVVCNANSSWSRVLGWSQEELDGRTFIELVHPDDLERTKAEFTVLTERGTTTYFRNRYRSRDGSYRWFDWRGVVVPDDGGRVYAAARDITDEVLMRNSLKTREEILTRMVGEQFRVHDSAVQNSVAALMFLEPLLDAAGPDGDPLLERVRDQVAASLAATRKVMVGLDPLEVGDLDMAEAIEALIGEVAGQFELAVQSSVDLEGGPTPDSELATASCRIIREALTNAAKHAGVLSARVEVINSTAGLSVSVHDAGHGICAAVDSTDGSGLGLPTMQERIRALQGNLRVETGGSGTSIVAWLPHERHRHAFDHSSSAVA
jgi:PAS domain S-box-containing protein